MHYAIPFNTYLLTYFSLIAMQNLVVVYVCVHAGGPKHFEDAEAQPFETGIWRTPINTLFLHKVVLAA